MHSMGLSVCPSVYISKKHFTPKCKVGHACVNMCDGEWSSYYLIFSGGVIVYISAGGGKCFTMSNTMR